MQSHVLLAACSSKGLAYEDLDTTPHHGYFTTALLKILRSVGPARLTYKSCIQRMPKLESSTPQDPVCEGINVNRMFFNAMASGADSSFILLEEKRSELYLQAGAVHGITPGCLFAIHADLILDPANPPLGTMIVHQVTPFRSLLKIGDDTPSFAVPKPAYGRQIGTGNEHALDIYITPEFENVIPPDPRWEVAFSGKEKDVVLRLVERDMAALIVDVDDNSWATFTLPRLKPAIKYGITTLKRAVPTEFQDVYHVISSAARFIWHLERFPQSRPFQAGVKVEFYKLKESGKYEETGSPILEIDGDDLNERGVARVTVDNEDRYGFHIINTTSRDLYAYLFYFSVTTLAITSKFLPVIGSGQVDPSLPIGATLPLGYGSGGVKPFQFSLKRGEPLDVGVFKLFLATAPIDLGSIEQPLPFRIEPRRLIGENEAKHQFATLQVGIWDAITMELELTEPPETSSFVEPGVNSPPTWDEAQKGVSKPASPFDYLTAEKQHALLKDFKLTCGLTIDSDYGPRFSDRSVLVLTRPASELFGFHNTTITEEVVSSSMLDAVFAHNGFPPLNNMSNLPLLDDLFVSNDGAQKWTTRRMIIGKLDFSASTEDFLPNVEFISDVQDALNHSKDWQKLKALKDVVETWGVVIPLSGVIGYSSVATEIDRKPDWPRPPPIEELESNNYDNSRMVKVTRVASILELLEDSLQDQVKQLYASLIFRSPCVGMHQLFGFDGTMNQGRQMEEIEIGFSDLRIESIVVRYRGGHVVGPYGISGMPTQFERFSIDRDEGITDILVWAADSHISSLQILESSGRASPIYGTKKGITQPPKLLSGNGCFLVGLSGGFDKFGVTQIQAVWRGDTHTKGYRCKQTSHVGGKTERFGAT
ncbi:hypothetical protein B0J17DRAFT_460706 [Rhizoctonia solani]|nr:hypothetical protein B0J17DRAFT_460706 [Rhizoctonia solani]